MKIYNYNKDTKEYVSTTQASENPLEKGKYLIPANATTISINTDKDGFVQVFDEANQKWDYVEDNRGKIVYDTTTKQESKVDYLGAIKDGFTELVPSEFDVWNGLSWEVDTVEQITAQTIDINNAIKNHLDTKAQEFKYDNMMSARSYTGYTNPFQIEAQALATWCADCWDTAGTIQADVEAGNRAMPTVDEVLAELPVYVGV